MTTSRRLQTLRSRSLPSSSSARSLRDSSRMRWALRSISSLPSRRRRDSSSAVSRAISARRRACSSRRCTSSLSRESSWSKRATMPRTRMSDELRECCSFGGEPSLGKASEGEAGRLLRPVMEGERMLFRRSGDKAWSGVPGAGDVGDVSSGCVSIASIVSSRWCASLVGEGELGGNLGSKGECGREECAAARQAGVVCNAGVRVETGFSSNVPLRADPAATPQPLHHLFLTLDSPIEI